MGSDRKQEHYLLSPGEQPLSMKVSMPIIITCPSTVRSTAHHQVMLAALDMDMDTDDSHE